MLQICVCVSQEVDVHIQLPLQQFQAGRIAPGNYLMAMNQPNSDLPDSYNILFGIIQALRRGKSWTVSQ